MKKSHKILLYIVLWYVCYYVLYLSTKNTQVNKGDLAIIAFLIPFIVVFCTKEMNKAIKNNRYSKIKSISENYKLLCELNEKYTFNDLGETNRIIFEKEYSHKSYDRAVASDIVLYQIENNNNGIRDFILNAYRNEAIYDNYLNDFNNINILPSEEKMDSIGMNKEKYIKWENELLESEKIKDTVYNITVNVVVSYVTQAGRYNYRKNRIVTYQELCDLYMQWRNGKKYEETSKRERKYMTDQLRYDVLKRDNFTCQKCGATAKDGAKLHVDHIIPVYKGGKSTMSNLQTLCDRCNIGKGTKDN